MSTDADEWMISVDDHIIEQPSVWQDRLPSGLRERGPRWVAFEDGGEGWLFDGSARGGVAAMNVNGALPDDAQYPGDIGLPWEAVPAEAYDPATRVRAMDSNRVAATLFFPNYPGFTGNLFLNSQDRTLALACIKAYNNWVIEEWCLPFPDRFIAQILLPLWDPQLSAMEVERTATLGARAACFPGLIHNLDLPPITDHQHWDPLFSAMNDARMVFNSHGGTMPASKRAGRHRIRQYADPASLDGLRGHVEPPAPKRKQNTDDVSSSPSSKKVDYQADHVREWLSGGVFERYPNIKLIYSEIKIGWVPSVIDSMPDPDQARAVYRDNMYAAWIPAPASGHGVQEFVERDVLDAIGLNNVVCETDFPHSPSLWPHSVTRACETFDLLGLSGPVQRKLLFETAEGLLNLEPTARSKVAAAATSAPNGYQSE